MKATKYRADSALILARRVLRIGDAVLEIGAADGEHTRIYADRVGRTGQVVAVEPNRAHVAQLRAIASECPWVVVHESAVGAESGECDLQVDEAHPQWSSVYPANVGMLGESYRVPMTTVDALVLGMSQTRRLIQVDAQGAEAAILRGATVTLSLPIVWVMEFWRDGLRTAGDSVEDVIAAFRAYGFAPSNVFGTACDWDEVSAVVNGRPGWSYCDFVLWPRSVAA